MFEKSKIIWHLTQIEIAADTDQRMREPIAQMAMKSGAMDRALKFAEENEDRALGAVYLVVCLCEMALEKNAPQQLADALEDLLFAAIDVIEARYTENPLTCEILQHQIMELQEQFLARKFASEAPSTSNPTQATAPGMQLTGNMPDVTRRQPIRAFQSGRYLILFLKDVPPIAEQIGPNPLKLRFIYVLAVIDFESQRPVYFVTLESSMMAANVLGTIDSSGAHDNLGSLPSLLEERTFIDRALLLVKEHLGIDGVEELKR